MAWRRLIYFFSHAMYYFAFYSLSFLVVTQIRGHIAGSSSPLHTTVRALHFYSEQTSPLSSLVESRPMYVSSYIFY